MKQQEFTPKQWMLVRDSEEQKWSLARYSHYDTDYTCPHRMLLNVGYEFCIPFEGNEHLLGTTDDYVEQWQPKDGDFVRLEYQGGDEMLCIYKSKIDNHPVDENYDYDTYAAYFIASDHIKIEAIISGSYVDVYEATEEEKQLFLSKLARSGKKWNPEKKCIEDVYQPKDGDFVTYTYPKGNKYVAIYYYKESNTIDTYYAELCLINQYSGFVNKITYKNRFERDYTERRPSTEEEKQQLLDALHEEGKDWDEVKKEIVEYKWKPKHGEDYWFVNTAGEPKVVENLDIENRDVNRIKRGNCFRTREAAQAMADKFKKLLKGE